MKKNGILDKTSKILYNGMDRIVRVIHMICGFLTLAFFVMTFFQVIMRYVFSNPIFGIEEGVIVLVVWTSALGMSIVYWNNEHPKLTVLMEVLPSWVRVSMHYVTSLIVFILGWFFVEGGLTLFQVQMKTVPTGGLPFCKAYYYALPMIIAGVLLLVMSVIRMLRFVVTRDESIMQDTPQEGGVSVD